VVGTSIDSHIDAVLRDLPTSVSVCRLDVDRYPQDLKLTVRPFGTPRVVLRDESVAWVLDDCAVAWFRRLGQPGLHPDVPRTQRKFALGEAEQALTAALDLIRPRRWLNSFWPTRRAAIKPWQYAVIGSLGIPIPDVIVTNSADDARAWAAAGRRIVYKTLHAPVLEDDEEGERRMVFTSAVVDADLEDVDAIGLAPCQFQRLAHAAYELRVTTIGAAHIGVRIDHPPWESGEAPDWRAHHGQLRYSPYTLPDHVATQLDQLMKALGLQYAASDWIVEPTGKHVLLEVNPHGAWLWLEREVDVAITAAVARYCSDGLPEHQ
jgi:hypothetical protein